MARFRSFVELAATGGLRRQLGGDADVVHDVRHAARMLRRSPAFTVSAVVILGVGIGGTVAIVSLLDALLLKPLPYHEADRVVTLWQRPVAGADREDVAPANFLDWRERARSFERMAAAIPYSYDYTGGTEPEVFFGAQVTEGFFDALGVLPILGRTFRPEEHVRGARPVVIITHGLWQRRFGGSPGILDQPVDLEGVPFTVVGVLPREFAPQMLPRPGELGVWTPKIVQEHERRVRGSAWWNVVARLRPDVSLEAAQAEMRQIASTLADEHPRTNTSVSVEVLSLRDHLAGSVRLPLLLMFGGVLLVLLIGCANVASLLLARGLNREREFAIRAALGAGRWRLIRQLGTESLVLSLAAALLGVATAHWVMRAVVALAPPGVARLSDAAIDARTLGFALLLACCTAFAFGLFPAFQFSRPSREAIRERQGSVPRAVLRRSLVAGEVALALVLLAGAGLLVRSFQGLLAVDPGFSPAGVVALQVFAHDRNGSDQRARQFFRSTL
ncbi:MAG TPA: ABC transporter permease, partial [Vicinamibacterales bacterium]|nr:ABC transporter permease [Vicinamibacterales bacterium]